MFKKKILFIILLIIFYQTPSSSKSTSFIDIDAKIFSKYFSGLVAFDDKNNSEALNFFESSKTLVNSHETFLEKYIYSLVLENKVSKSIKEIKKNKHKINSNFFDAHLLIILDYLKKNNLDKAYEYLKKLDLKNGEKINMAILESFIQYIYVFKEKKFLGDKKDYGILSTISETFQRCYLNDPKTDKFFTNLINDISGDYSRYTFFYLSYLVENNRIEYAKKITNDVDNLNTTLLLSQAKGWVDNENTDKFSRVFSCKNHNDVIGEFLFLISNLYSSQDNFKKSNFYLNLSYFLNPKFVFNLSLVAENQYINGEYEKLSSTLRNFKKDNNFYYWYRVKKEAQIIIKLKNKKDSIDYLKSEFEKIKNPNRKILFDIANFYRNLKEYDEAIIYYTKILESLNYNSTIISEVLYRRGGSYERIGDYKKADIDLLKSLEINPDNAYVLNYLAYSWLERNYKISKAIEMLETAYAMESNDPYIIDSIGWAYYLTKDYLKAEKFLKRAVEMMPEDPIVNDHYGDILWRLDRKIQARYFWNNVLKMKDAEDDMIEKINVKIIKGLKNS